MPRSAGRSTAAELAPSRDRDEVQRPAGDGEDALAVGLHDVGLVDAGDLDVGARVGGSSAVGARPASAAVVVGGVGGRHRGIGRGAHLRAAGRADVLHLDGDRPA